MPDRELDRAVHRDLARCGASAPGSRTVPARSRRTPARSSPSGGVRVGTTSSVISSPRESGQLLVADRLGDRLVAAQRTEVREHRVRGVEHPQLGLLPRLHIAGEYGAAALPGGPRARRSRPRSPIAGTVPRPPRPRPVRRAAERPRHGPRPLSPARSGRPCWPGTASPRTLAGTLPSASKYSVTNVRRKGPLATRLSQETIVNGSSRRAIAAASWPTTVRGGRPVRSAWISGSSRSARRPRPGTPSP